MKAVFMSSRGLSMIPRLWWDQVEIVVQVNGRIRDKIMVAADASQQEIEDMVLSLPRIQGHIGDKKVAKVIVVPKILVNIVVKG